MSKRCLGLDLHKTQITAHFRVQERLNGRPKDERLQFGTMPDDLERLRDWVIEHKVTLVVMESTSVYWMHVNELLEDVTTVLVANAAHVKKVPGRKTDVADAEWLAELGAHGLLRASFIPPKPIRQLRAVSRYRTKLVATQTACRNRTIKLIEMAGVKLSSVVCDSFGVTGRRILDALTHPEPPDISQLAVGSLKEKIPQLTRCIGRGLLDDEHRSLLRMHLDAYDGIDAQVARTEKRLLELGATWDAILTRLDDIPGVNRLGAVTVLSEVGADMSVYRSADHLCALAGVAPGNAVSDKKRRRISVRKGNVHLKRILVQIAWAASRKKDSFLRSRFLRLQKRIGRNKAIVAVARQVLIIIYFVISGAPYRERGETYMKEQDKARAVKTLLTRLSTLGYAAEIKKIT
jgi:transposase